MNAPRTHDTATLLANGEVLMAGSAIGGTTLTSAELYNPATGAWTLTGSMTTQRAFQTATLLNNGQVLVAGGGTSTAELYNPATGKWTLTGSMSASRSGATAALLRGGQVLVAGGQAPNGSPLSSAELYNPATGTWARTGSMTTGRNQATATLLNSGQVLVAGGGTSTAELYNPATGKFTATGSMDTGRMDSNAVLLQDGDALVTSGIAAGGPFAEVYHPATGQWSDAIGGLAVCTAVRECRFYSSETLLPTGNVLVAGGTQGLASTPSTTASAMLYNPATNAWTATGSMNGDRDMQTATLLPDGQVLVAGGTTFHTHRATVLATAELYTP
jgi:N-acetylneuraminic acid mutarotase